ncbi:MAG: hypothetical protein FWE07_07130 [Turicibacter sp.]|nr:hypothetical protein [Turicibacter sp.]
MVQRIRQPDHNVKKKNKVVPFLVFLNVLLWGSAIYLWFQNHESRPTVSSDFTYTQEIEPFNVIPNPTFNDHSVEEYSEVTFSIHSNYALLINLTTGDVLFAHNERERAYPASITKIMTVLVALEHAEEETLTVQADFNELYIAQAATAGFEYGETRTLS